MIDICSLEKNTLLTLSEAIAKILLAIKPVAGEEAVTLPNALGRVLAQNLYSPIALPSDRNSAMDGYAFSSEDVTDEQPFSLVLAGTSWAGAPFTGHLQRGQCIRIFTGAVVPLEADSVVMQEQVQVDDDRIQFSAQTQCQQNIRQIGEDIPQNAPLMSRGKKLTAYDIALLASAGIAEVSVIRPLRICVFSTGDELTPLGQSLTTGKIYDSNRHLLLALLTDPAFKVEDGGIIADNEQEIAAKLRQAAHKADVIITSGGVSVGNADHVKNVLARCGEVDFWKIAIKPGKPMAFGHIDHVPFFGLPGNPVAVAATFQTLVAPALRQLLGEPPKQRLRVRAICTAEIRNAKGRMTFLRGFLKQDEAGDFWVSAFTAQSSNMLGSLSQSNCFIVLPADCSRILAGQSVEVEPFATRI